MCEKDKHKYALEPIQTVSRAIDNGEIHSVTIFLQHCTECGHSQEIAIHEDYDHINPNAT